MRRASSFSLRSVGLTLAMLLSLLVTSTANAAPPAAGDAYIVVFNNDVDVDVAVPAVARAHGLTVGHVYRHAIKGMSVSVPAGRLAALRNNPNVAYVETDDLVQLEEQAIPTGIRRIDATGNSNLAIDGADDRVDVDVAVIDTGVDFEHPDLNVVGGVDCTLTSGGGPPWARQRYCSETEGTGGDDDHYHGTHVAGTIGALDNGIGVVGVAPGARIWAVKVLDSGGSGYESGIVAGIDWIVATEGTIEVANMSLSGGGDSQAEYDAIQRAVEGGVAFAVAAGNDGDDALEYSPAAFDNVLTVSALADFDGVPGGLGSSTCRNDQDDTLADFSNWGPAVDIAAPGVCIHSTYPLEQGSYATISGTSMASPHVAGALAILASTTPASNVAGVEHLYDTLTSAGKLDWTDESGDGIHEPLLDVSTFSATLIPGGGTTNNPPTVSIDSPADGATFGSGDSVSFTGTASDLEDGNITEILGWSSNLDGQIGTGGSFSEVLSEGIHTITATVTDDGGNTSSDAITVTVGDSGGSLSLAAAGFKDKGQKYVDLTWSPGSTKVDVYHNGGIYGAADGGAVRVGPFGRGGGSDTFQVCEAKTTTCSNTVTINW